MQSSGKKIKVLIVVSQVDRAVGFEWIAERLDPERFVLEFALLNDRESYLARHMMSKGIAVHEIFFSGRRQFISSLVKMLRVLRVAKPDIVHTHLHAANIVGQTAAWLLRVPKRIYTRHSGNENRRYHGKQRIDHIVNKLATDIVAISENVRHILEEEENVPPHKISLVHHGFDLESFETVPVSKIEALRKKYNPDSRSPVIGVIARYSHWKGIQHIIPAFRDLLKKHPDALLILANARHGDYRDEIAGMLADLPQESFCEIEFEHDIFGLYGLFDVYVHTPIDPELEAFGQTYVEALAAKIPSVFTLSGVAREFIVDGENALVVDFEDSAAIRDSIFKLLEDGKLREKLAARGSSDVRDNFGLEKMISRLEDLYIEKSKVGRGRTG